MREKLIEVTKKRQGMTDQWETRWEYLQLSKYGCITINDISTTGNFLFHFCVHLKDNNQKQIIGIVMFCSLNNF